MAFTEIIDGVRWVKFMPADDVPTYGDWLKVLLERGAAFERNGLGRDGNARMMIVPIDQHQEQKAVINHEGVAEIMCICCAKLSSRLDMNLIRIGGIVQFPEEIPNGIVNGLEEIVRKFKRQPVSKRGLGCPVCQAEFFEVEQVINKQNAKRSAINNSLGELAILKAAIEGKAIETFKGQSMLTPYIDIFKRDALDGAVQFVERT